MNKKKAIKIVAASAIAASAFAAVAPTQSQAATSVATTVSNAQKAMKAPFDKYYQTGITKKTVSAATVQALITTGTKAYTDATAAVKKAGGSSAKTNQAKLDSYKKYLDRSKAYVAGLGSISKVYANADSAIKTNTVSALEKSQAELKNSHNQGFVGISKIYGPEVRATLTATFTKLSQGKLDKVEAALKVLNTVDKVSAVSDVEVNEGSASVTLPTTVEVTLKSGAKVQKAVEWNKSTADLNKPGTYVVKGDVADTDLEASVNVVVKEVTPAVTSVSAINGKEIEVKFNKEVDATSAENEDNYKLLNGSTALASSDFEATLQDDNKTVILTLDNAIDKDTTAKFSVTIQNVLLKGSYLDKIAYFAGVVTVSDKKAPEIASVKSVTNSATASSVTVNFSEPVVSPTIKIDGVTKSAVLSADGYSATVSNLELSASASHTVEAINLTDAAGNVSNSSLKTFTVTNDTAAATYTVSTKSDNQIVLTYNKSMDVNTVLAGTTLKDGNLDTVTNYNVAVVPNTSNKVFTITIQDASKPFTASKTSANYTVVSTNTIADYLGNKSAATTSNATLTYDTVAPTVSNISYVKDSAGVVSKVLVKYNEAVTATTNNALSIVNLTTGSTVATSTGVRVLSDDQTVEYTLPSNIKLAGQYEVKLAGSAAADTSFDNNVSLASKQNVDFGSGTASELKVSSAAVVNNVATIRFDSSVTYATATNPVNYTINGVALPSDTTITLSSVNGGTNNQVSFTLPANFIAANDNGAVLRVANVKTPTDVTVSTNQNVVRVLDNTGAKISKSASSVNSNGTLTLGFDEAVKVLANTTPEADLTLNLGGVTVDTSDSDVQGDIGVATGIGSDAGKLVFTFTTNQDTVTGVTAKDAGFYPATGNAYTPVAGDTITNAGTTYTYYAADDVIVPAAGGNPAVTAATAGFYSATGVAYAPVAGDTITNAGTAYTYTNAVQAVTASKTEYFDANGNNSYDSSADILVKQVTGDDAAAYQYAGTLDLNKISSITVGTKASGLASIADTTGQDNKLQTKQSVVIK
ncbi:Ig-like domain-containing protein [Peribacillus sp. B-H-3]|uniref:Ig-like domain-containing protein n=1 Tax=Peribacillus sp. B-H-3 TaxID=3400420 RepID=UPI003B02777F